MVLVVEILIYVTCASLSVFVARKFISECGSIQRDQEQQSNHLSMTVKKLKDTTNAANTDKVKVPHRYPSIFDQQDIEEYKDSHDADVNLVIKAYSMDNVKYNYLRSKNTINFKDT